MIYSHCDHENFHERHAWALRLIRSRLDDSDISQDTPSQIEAEIANCPGCWQAIAVYVAALAAEYLTLACGGSGGYIQTDYEAREDAAQREAIAVIEARMVEDLDREN